MGVEIVPVDLGVKLTAKGDQWGEKRLRRAFHRNAAMQPDELRDLLVKTAFEFYRGTAPDDDLTVVVARAD